MKFSNGKLEIDVKVSPNEDTVWLSANHMSSLFERDAKTIRKHINNIFKDEELDEISNTQKMRVTNSDKSVVFIPLMLSFR